MIKVKHFISAKVSNSPNGVHSREGSPMINKKRLMQQSPYEVTSGKIEMLLNNGDIRTAVAVITTLQADYLLKCVPSFPLKCMKLLLPKSLPVWEVLLDKINDIEDVSAPQSVYTVYDSLVLQCAHKMLHYRASSTQDSNTDVAAIHQILRKVYLQYPEVVERFNGLKEQTDLAVHALMQHFPLQLESAMIPLQDAIRNEVSSSILDFQESLTNLDNLTTQEKFSLSEMLISGQDFDSQGRESSPPPVTPPLTQLQMQERLYYNQAVLRTIQPTRRKGNLAVLSEMLMERIHGDKGVITLFGQLRNELDISGDMPVEICLKQHQQALELVTNALKKLKLEVDGANVVELTDIYLTTSVKSSSTNGIHRASLGDLLQGSSSLLSQPSFDGSAMSVDSLAIKGNLSPVNNGLIVHRRSTAHTKSLSCISSSSITSKSTPLFRTGSGETTQNSDVFSSSRRSTIKSTTSNEFSCFQELELIKVELQQAQETIQQLKNKEKDLTDRLSEQAQKHLEGSTVFEDLSLGANRPTQLIRRYQELYCQGRVEVIETLEEQDVEDDLVSTIPLDIIQMSCKLVQSTLEDINTNWKKVLFLTEQKSAASLQIEKSINAYLRKDCSPKKLNILQTLEHQLWTKHSVSSAVKSATTIKAFMEDCIQIAWAFAVQWNPMTISCEETLFITDYHTRFFTSDPDNHKIKAYLWPILLQSSCDSSNVLFKGVVIT